MSLKKKFKYTFIFIILLLIVLWLVWFLYFSGRTASRILGEGSAQVIKLENIEKDGFISISYDTRGTSTVKDITYKATDGYVYTQEFKDISPFEGAIRWTPYGEGSSVIQSRAISRWTGGAVNLEIPEKCTEIVGVDVIYSASSERTKNLTCKTTDGKIISKEYREGFVDRFFEGYLEIENG